MPPLDLTEQPAISALGDLDDDIDALLTARGMGRGQRWFPSRSEVPPHPDGEPGASE